MNQNFLELGKELIEGISKTWSTLEYLTPELIKDSILERIGKVIYFNKEIFNDYLYYKYELPEYYKKINKDMPKGGFYCEWWSDDRGPSYQRDTFRLLVDFVLEILLSDEGGFYCDDETGYFIPKGLHYSQSKNCLVFDFNNELECKLFTK